MKPTRVIKNEIETCTFEDVSIGGIKYGLCIENFDEQLNLKFIQDDLLVYEITILADPMLQLRAKRLANNGYEDSKVADKWNEELKLAFGKK